MVATVVEVGGTSEHHVAHGGRRPELAVGRGLLDSRSEVHGDTGDVEVITDLDLPGVHAGADLDAESGELVAQRTTTIDALRRCIEHDQQPIAGALDHSATVVIDQLASKPVVVIEHGAPRGVAERARRAGRVDDVGEHDGRETTRGQPLDRRARQELEHRIDDRSPTR